MAKKKKKKTKIVYRTGMDLMQIAKELTGHSYMVYRLLEKNGINVNQLKDGTILKWGE